MRRPLDNGRTAQRATKMQYIGSILEHVVAIIAEAAKSGLGLIALAVTAFAALVIVFVVLTARARPILGFVVVLGVMLVSTGVTFAMFSADKQQKPIVYDAARLSTLQNVSFKVPHLDPQTDIYRLFDGQLQRQSDGTWSELQPHPAGDFDKYEYRLTNAENGHLEYRRLDDSIELYVDITKRWVCFREPGKTYRCPYAVVQID
jgi:hypothetical protein